jgi:2-haloacid dehalogenase
MSLMGRFHPLLVHFPIGLVLTAAGSEFAARMRRQSWRAVAVANFRAGALFSALTVLAGWVLASASFVEATPSLTWHRRIGVAAAVATMGAAVASRSRQVESGRSLLVYRGALFGLVLVAGIVVAFPAAGKAGAHREAAATTGFKAIAFDYFTLFNPDSVVPEVERVFPGKGQQLTNLWRTRQFEYSWLRSITDRYVDFFGITEDALVYAANAMKLELTPDDKQHLLEAYLHLTPWPDTAGALSRLKESGIRIITIANLSPTMLRSNAENAGLIGFFDALVSTDANHTYKPDPRAYRLGMDRLHLEKSDMLFVAFGGWDAAGAKSFGYPTVWLNRLNQPFEELGSRPDETFTDLNGVVDFVLNKARAHR